MIAQDGIDAAVEYLHRHGMVCPADGVHDSLSRPTHHLLSLGFEEVDVASIMSAWVGGNGSSRRAPGEIDREIDEAIRSALEWRKKPRDQRAPRAPKWPQACAEEIARIVHGSDLTLEQLKKSSPFVWGSTPVQNRCRRTLWELFNEGDLITLGRTQELPDGRRVKSAWTKPRDNHKCPAFAEYIVPTTASSTEGLNRRGQVSKRAKAMFEGRPRDYLVVEIDPPDKEVKPELNALLAPFDHQARVLVHLRKILPLVMVVRTGIGGKSLHGWYVGSHLKDEDVLSFYQTAVALGADKATYQPHQLVRLPWGRRYEELNEDGSLRKGGVQEAVWFDPRQRRNA